MPNIITPNLGLVVPGELTEPGPDYAAEINQDLITIDSLVYSLNNKVPSAGINIDDDIEFSNNNLDTVRSTRYVNSGFNLTGPDDKNNTYVFAGDFWFNNAAGTQVQITKDGQVQASSTALNSQNITANYTLNAGGNLNDLRVYLSSSPINITLPAASAAGSGRFYYITDINGISAVYNITLIRNGSDTFNNVSSNLAFATNLGSILIESDGVSNWVVRYFTTKIMLDGRFGTDTQNVLVQGASAAVKALNAGGVIIGASTNTVGINGTVNTFQASTSINILAPTVTINAAGSGLFAVNSNAQFTYDVNINGNLTTAGNATINAPITINAASTINGLITINNNSIIGSSGTDTCTINAGLSVAGNEVHTGNETHTGNINWTGLTTFSGSTNTFSNTIISNDIQSVSLEISILGPAGTGHITLTGPIVTGGGGRVSKSAFTLPNSNATIAIVDYNLANITATTSRVYTLDNTGQVAGDYIRFVNTSAQTHSIVFPSPIGSYSIAAAGSVTAPKIVEACLSASGWIITDWN